MSAAVLIAVFVMPWLWSAAVTGMDIDMQRIADMGGHQRFRAFDVTIQRSFHERGVMFDRDGLAQRLHGLLIPMQQAGGRPQRWRQAQEAVMATQLIRDRGLEVEQPVGCCRAEQRPVESLVLFVPFVDHFVGRVINRGLAARQPVVGRDDGIFPFLAAFLDRFLEQRQLNHQPGA